jgi:flagellar FliJ protein
VKRAAFRLQPVLELRRTEERAAALAAAEAARAAADADRRATEAEAAVASARAAAAEQAELVRAAWTSAAQRTKGLERLRERHLQAVRLAEQAAEERTVDDLVTGRSGRRTRTDGEAAWTD